LEVKEEGEMRFRAPSVLLEVLLDRSSKSFAGGFSGLVCNQVKNMDIVEAFMRTGKGYSFDQVDPEFVEHMELMHEPFVRFHFWKAVAASSILSERLFRDDITIVDIGCSSGQLLRSIAERSKASLLGLDVSEEFLLSGREKARQTGQTIEFQKVGYKGEGLPEDFCEVCIISDVIHDATDPLALVSSAYKCLKPGGVFFSIEPKTHTSLIDQLRDKNSTFKYCMSIHVSKFCCLLLLS
jgi:2-polyprenyl-3-methyl-5-hydroxy-6-metoxy-1,4-benzoquinol methylase